MKFGYSQVTSAPPGNVGFTGQDKCFLTAHAALTAGDIVAVDFSTATAAAPYATSTMAVGSAQSDVLGVVEADAASGAVARITIRGTIEASVDGVTIDVATGDPLGCAAAESDLKALAAGQKVVGQALFANTGAATVGHVLFNGAEGFGYDQT